VHEVSSDQFKTLTLARLASLLTSCPDPTPAERQLGLIYCLEAAYLDLDSQQSGAIEISSEWATRGQQLADALSTDQLSAALAEAIRRDKLRAAHAVIRQLGQRSDRSALTSPHGSPQGRPSPLVQVLRHPSPELRFAALRAIMKMAPAGSFAGSSYLPEALWAFSMGSGPLEALVISPLARRRTAWAGQLRQLCYDAIPMATGRGALQSAAQLTRLALILVDASVSRPTVREVHYQLRASTQAGRVPMAIVCDAARLLEFDRLAATDPLSLAVVRPSDESRLTGMIEHLQQLAQPPPASDTVRLERARQALNGLTQLLQFPSSMAGNVYQELRRHHGIAEQTLFQPKLADASLRLLEHLGTADSQFNLLKYASGKTLPIENRRAAVHALAASVNHYGVLLTTQQIRAQYDRYNASQTDDHETQQVLGKLLDVLESRRSVQ